MNSANVESTQVCLWNARVQTERVSVVFCPGLPRVGGKLTASSNYWSWQWYPCRLNPRLFSISYLRIRLVSSDLEGCQIIGIRASEVCCAIKRQNQSLGLGHSTPTSIVHMSHVSWIKNESGFHNIVGKKKYAWLSAVLGNDFFTVFYIVCSLSLYYMACSLSLSCFITQLHYSQKPQLERCWAEALCLLMLSWPQTYSCRLSG